MHDVWRVDDLNSCFLLGRRQSWRDVAWPQRPNCLYISGSKLEILGPRAQHVKKCTRKELEMADETCGNVEIRDMVTFSLDLQSLADKITTVLLVRLLITKQATYLRSSCYLGLYGEQAAFVILFLSSDMRATPNPGSEECCLTIWRLTCCHQRGLAPHRYVGAGCRYLQVTIIADAISNCKFIPCEMCKLTMWPSITLEVMGTR